MGGASKSGEGSSQVAGNGTGFDITSLPPQVPQFGSASPHPQQEVMPNPESVEKQNMQLWDKVCRTNTEYTKPTSFGSMKFTAIDPQYQLQEATKLWGPYGKNWGLFDLRFQTIETSEKDRTGEYLATTTMILEAMFRYPGGQFPIAVDQKFKPGQDVMKKLITSARSKALSFLGFSADVFLGKFDDVSYVSDLKIREGQQDAFEQKALSSIRTAKTHDALDKMRSRIEGMVADDTISGDQGAYLFDEIHERRRHLLEQNIVPTVSQ